MKMNDVEFHALLNVLIEADPWRFSANRDVIENMLDMEAHARGYDDWIDALHLFQIGPEPPPPETFDCPVHGRAGTDKDCPRC